MRVNTCANCNYQFDQTTPYCPQCGQKSNTHRFTLPHLAHEVVHVATHADKGIFLLIKELLLRPGVVLHDYIVLQRRKKYFNPFTFLVLMAGLLLFTTNIFKPYITENMYNKEQTSKMERVMGKDKATVVVERSANLNRFMEKNSKLILMASVPITALVFWVFFRRRGHYFAEHLVAAVFLTAILGFIMAVIFTPLLGTFRNSFTYGIITFITLVFQLLYFGWAYQVFLQKQAPLARWKPYAVSLLNILIWSLVSVVTGIIYIYAGLFF